MLILLGLVLGILAGIISTIFPTLNGVLMIMALYGLKVNTEAAFVYIVSLSAIYGIGQFAGRYLNPTSPEDFYISDSAASYSKNGMGIIAAAKASDLYMFVFLAGSLASCILVFSSVISKTEMTQMWYISIGVSVLLWLWTISQSNNKGKAVITVALVSIFALVAVRAGGKLPTFNLFAVLYALPALLSLLQSNKVISKQYAVGGSQHIPFNNFGYYEALLSGLGSAILIGLPSSLILSLLGEDNNSKTPTGDKLAKDAVSSGCQSFAGLLLFVTIGSARDSVSSTLDLIVPSKLSPTTALIIIVISAVITLCAHANMSALTNLYIAINNGLGQRLIAMICLAAMGGIMVLTAGPLVTIGLLLGGFGLCTLANSFELQPEHMSIAVSILPIFAFMGLI